MTIAEVYFNASKEYDKALFELSTPLNEFLQKTHLKWNPLSHIEANYGGKEGAQRFLNGLGRVTIQKDLKAGYICVQINKIGAFYVRRYPACCGLYMFHNFTSYNACKVPDELIFPILDYVLVNMAGQDVYGKNYRIQVMMVEPVSSETRNRIQKAAKEQGTDDYRMLEIPNIGKPEAIQYNLYHRYFTQHCKWHRDRVFWNCNSENLIHELEVIVK